MKKISKFDLGMIIAFVVVALLGGGAWYYVSGMLTDAQEAAGAAKSDFEKNSSNKGIAVSQPNTKSLHENIDLLKAQLTPLIEDKLHSKDNKVFAVERKDPVAWKHDLDSEVARLTNASKLRGVKLPAGFPFGFSSYLQKNPKDEQTLVLSKQLLAIEQLSGILINAPVRSIDSIKRTYEEDDHRTSAAPGGSRQQGDTDRLDGFSVGAAGGAYTAYPFEVEFDTTTESLRKVIDGLQRSPYIFVLRSIAIKNVQTESPKLDEQDKMAGTDTNSPSVTGSSPGEVAATTSTKGPQFLFGNTLLHVKARIDMIEWTAPAPDDSTDKNSSPAGK